jgi:hypothetical protein
MATAVTSQGEPAVLVDDELRAFKLDERRVRRVLPTPDARFLFLVSPDRIDVCRTPLVSRDACRLAVVGVQGKLVAEKRKTLVVRLRNAGESVVRASRAVLGGQGIASDSHDYPFAEPIAPNAEFDLSFQVRADEVGDVRLTLRVDLNDEIGKIAELELEPADLVVESLSGD